MLKPMKFGFKSMPNILSYFKSTIFFSFSIIVSSYEMNTFNAIRFTVTYTEVTYETAH